MSFENVVVLIVADGKSMGGNFEWSARKIRAATVINVVNVPIPEKPNKYKYTRNVNSGKLIVEVIKLLGIRLPHIRHAIPSGAEYRGFEQAKPKTNPDMPP